MIIRKMNEQDLEEVLLLEKELFASPWNREHFLFELNEKSVFTLFGRSCR
jgi:ribosomal protein S18 acetylase RimI-like enzyme